MAVSKFEVVWYMDMVGFSPSRLWGANALPGIGSRISCLEICSFVKNSDVKALIAENNSETCGGLAERFQVSDSPAPYREGVQFKQISTPDTVGSLQTTTSQTVSSPRFRRTHICIYQ